MFQLSPLKQKTTEKTFKWLEFDNNCRKLRALFNIFHTLQPIVGVFSSFSDVRQGLSSPLTEYLSTNGIIPEKHLLHNIYNAN